MLFDNSYARLPERFFARLPPTPVQAPKLVKLNEALARELGFDVGFLRSPEGVEVLAGTRVAEGSEPVAMAYAGHQFGNFVPQLGDGRAILLGEVIDAHGIRRDIHLKGSGPTPFSRRGDGRAALGPVLREYIVAEAMAALGIPTTRALSAVATGEEIWRETPLPGAVLARVASSHVRVGTFQYFAVRGDVEGLRALADYVIARHYPESAQAANPVRALLDAVIAAQASLVAEWMGIGFIHGVMNTDNMSIAGETIDYGPCAFMDKYHPETVFSSIDEMGRYAYGNQPRIAHWNLVRLAEALLPILGDDDEAARAQAQAAIDAYPALFQAQMEAVFHAKLGLASERADDMALVQDLLDRMAAQGADFTLTFRALCDAATGDERVRAQFTDSMAIDEWLVRWRARLAAEDVSPEARHDAMRRANPAFIPRNHRVEEALAAANGGDFAPFERLVQVLSKPFDDQPDFAAYKDAPRPDQVVLRTFCGT